MATRSENGTDDGYDGADGEHGARYAHLQLGDSVVIYDRTNEDAWLQSETVVGLGFMH